MLQFTTFLWTCSKMSQHINLQPAGSSVNSDWFEHTSQFWVVVYAKMCFEAYTIDPYI